MTTIRDIVHEAGALSPLPPTSSKLAAAVSNRDCALDDVVAVIQYDQALTANVLRFANSTASASSREIATVREAVIRLGGARILEQAIGRHVRSPMGVALPAYGYGEMELWRHSVAAAVASETLGTVVGGHVEGVAFTAALLHDIGKLLLGRAATKEEVEEIWSLVTGVPCTCEQAERRVLGFSHAEVGAEIAAAWKLPDGIVTGIRDHHSFAGEGSSIRDTVMLANMTARAIGEGIGHEGMSFALDATVAGRLGLSRDGLERLCALTAGKLKEVLSGYD